MYKESVMKLISKAYGEHDKLLFIRTLTPGGGRNIIKR